MRLKELQGRWLEKWDEMRGLESTQVALAAPFVSVGAYPPKRQLRTKIMLVGKATNGDWCISSSEKDRPRPQSDRLQERRGATQAFLKEHAPTHRSAFWSFSRELSKSLKANMIWTNAAKIGVWRTKDRSRSINPYGYFLEQQKELAVETLAAEVLEYAPDLVVCLTASDSLDEIVCLAFQSRGAWEEKSIPSGSPVWILPRTIGHPPVLCTGHPWFKSLDVRKGWVTEAEGLVARP